MMAACFALLLSSCVTNEESQSVTDIRNAKAEQLKSLAALNNAEAAAAKVLADAEAALKAAQAEAEAAKAAQIQAQIANDKLIAEAEAALLKAEAAYQEALAAQIEEEVEKAKLEYDALKAEYAARIAQAEKAKAEAEKAKAEALAELELVTINAQKALAEAKKELATAEQDLKDELERIEGENAVDLLALYNAYKDLAEDLIDAQETLIEYKAELVAVENDLVDTQKSLANLVKQNKKNIEYYELEIAYVNVQLENLKKYATVDSDEAYAAAMMAQADYYALNEDAERAYDVYEEAQNAAEEVHPWYVNEYESFANDLVYDYDLVDKFVGADGTVYDDFGSAMDDETAVQWYGFNVTKLNDMGKQETVWTPVFSNYLQEVMDENYNSPSLKYTLEGVEGEFDAWYTQFVTAGAIDAEGVAALRAYLEEEYLYNIEFYKKYGEQYKASLDAWTAVLEKAEAWAAAQYAYDEAYADAYENGKSGDMYNTAYYALRNAEYYAEEAKGAYDAAVEKVENLKEQLATLEKKETRWALEDAIEPLKAPAAETAKALKAAQDTLAVKEKALVDAQTAQKKAAADLEAKEIAERAAKKAYEAAAAVVTEAGDKATEAQKKAEEDAKEAYDKAVEATIKANTALAEAEAAVAEAETAVATAEADVEAAQTAADNAAAALKAAEDALANLDADIAALKTKIAYAEEDVVAPKAAYEEKVKELEAAQAAVDAIIETLPALEEALAPLQRETEVALLATDYANFVGGVYEDWMTGDTVDFTEAYDVLDFATSQVESWKNYVDMIDGEVDGNTDYLAEMLAEFDAAFEEAATLLEKTEAQIAEFNKLSLAVAEAEIVSAVADNAVSLKNAELQALIAVYQEADNLSQRILNLENNIASYEEYIAEMEAQIVEVENGTHDAIVDAEFVVAKWTEKVALQETFVELLEAEVAAAKAEFEAATKAE